MRNIFCPLINNGRLRAYLNNSLLKELEELLNLSRNKLTIMRMVDLDRNI